MLEALVGLAVGAVMGLGMAWGAAQALHSQRFATTQNMTVFAMRNALSNASALSSGSAPVTVAMPTGPAKTLAATKTCVATSTVMIAIPNHPETVNYQKPCSLSTNADTTNQSIVGGDGVIQF
jgi:glucosamine 6-phosphate synthetase-like amidotransferase/phosphosugar isomerase protein